MISKQIRKLRMYEIWRYEEMSRNFPQLHFPYYFHEVRPTPREQLSKWSFKTFQLFLGLLKQQPKLVLITLVSHAISAGAASAFLTYFNKQFEIQSEVLSQSFLPNFLFYLATFSLLEIGIISLQTKEQVPFDQNQIPDTKQQQSRVIYTGSLIIKISELSSIKSDDHYCQVTHKGGETYSRVRFKDLMDQFYDTDGILVHRGYWIAFSAIQSIDVTLKNPHSKLFDGTEIQIARSRATEIKRLKSLNWKHAMRIESATLVSPLFPTDIHYIWD